MYRSPSLRSDARTLIDQRSGLGDLRALQPGRSKLLDGATQRMEAEAYGLLDVSADFTVTFWFNVATFAVTGENYILTSRVDSVSNRIGIAYDSDGDRFGVELNDGTSRRKGMSSAIATLGTNVWNFGVVKWNASTSTLTLFVNDSEVTATNSVSGGASSDNRFRIGCNSSALDNWDGKLFDMRIFGREITAAEATALDTQGREPYHIVPGQPTDHIAGWLFDGNSTLIERNNGLGGSAYDATIVNGAVGMLHEGNDVPWSPQNLIGFAEVDNRLQYSEPANTSETSTDSAITWQLATGGLAEFVEYEIAMIDNALQRYGYQKHTSGNTDDYTFSLLVEMDDGSEPILTGSTSGRDFSIVFNGTTGFNQAFVSKTNVKNNVWLLEVTLAILATNVAFGVVKQLAHSAKGFRYSAFWLRPSTSVNARYFRTFASSEVQSNIQLLPYLSDGSGPTDTDTKEILRTGFTGQTPRDGELHSSPCAAFDGTDDYIQLTHGVAPTPDQPFEIEITYNQDQAAVSNKAIVGFGRSASSTSYIILLVHSDGNLQWFGLNTSGVNMFNMTSTGLTNDGLWHAAKVVGDGAGGLKLFRDDVEVFDGAWINWLDDDYDHNAVGASWRTTPGSFYQGAAYDYKFTKNGLIVVHCPFSEKFGNIAHNTVPGGNNGTAIGISESSFWGTTQDVYHRHFEMGCDVVGSFNGAGDHVSFPQLSDVTVGGTYTISVWFKAESISKAQVIFENALGASDRSGVGITTSGNLIIKHTDGASNPREGGAIALDGLWHHVVAVNDAGALTAWMDGNQISGSTSGSLDFSSVNRNWGRRSTGVSEFEGQLSNGRVFNVVKTPAQIASLFAKVDDQDDLILHHEFNTGSGANIPDLSGNGNDGTLVSSDVDAFWQEIPAANDGSSLVGRSAPSHPAGALNTKNTEVNFNVEPLAPWTRGQTLETGFVKGDGRTVPNYVTEAPTKDHKLYTDEP